MQRRYFIPEDELISIQEELKKRGYTLDDISDRIGANFRNFLYLNTTITEESFNKLKNLYGSEIEHETRNFINGAGFQKEVEVEKNREMAELVGILLGDGCISEYREKSEERYVSTNFVSVTLHEEEKEIFKRTKILMEECLDKNPAVERPEDKSIVNVRIHGKQYVQLLKQLGLESGDKVKNQVSVPKWIMKDPELQKGCLKGLIDTDGSIYRRSHDGYIVVNFKNRSKPLLEDFEKMCQEIGIHVSKSGKYDRQIARQEDVRGFLNKISPIKSKEIGKLA